MSSNKELSESAQADIRDEINAEHHYAREAAESAVGHAIQCGELLIEQKKRVGHGKFTAWIKENCDFSDDTARIYMRASRQKTRGLVFSSLSQLLAYDRADKVKPRAEYIVTTRPDFDLPPGRDVNQWAYAHQTEKQLQWFASFAKQIDPLAVARGALPEERKKLRAHQHALRCFAINLDMALSSVTWGHEYEPLESLPIDAQLKLYWNSEAELPTIEPEARTQQLAS
jgi:hypothetical protein